MTLTNHKPAPTWVIARDDPAPNGGTNTVYWCCDDDDPDIWPAPECWKGFGPPDAFGTIRTSPTKWEAITTFRENGNKMTRLYRAVKLTPEQAALLNPAPDDTTGPVIAAQEPTQDVSAEPAVASETSVTPLERTDAARIDAALRIEARTIAKSMQRFKKLICEAKTKQIHALLGFASWTAYVADVIGAEMKALPVDDRRQIVGLLAGEGMSQRAIADAIKVSQKTVDRDMDQLSHDDSVVLPDKVIGLDNKERPAHPPKPDVPKPKPAWEPPADPERPLEFSPDEIAKRPWLAPRSEWAKELPTGKTYPAQPKPDVPKPADKREDMPDWTNPLFTETKARRAPRPTFPRFTEARRAYLLKELDYWRQCSESVAVGDSSHDGYSLADLLTEVAVHIAEHEVTR
jgi:hypothetical protein